MTQPAIAIVGAGIGGLTAALAFGRDGYAVDVFEQSPALREVGAGLQLSPNATRVLDALDLNNELSRLWREPGQLRLLSGTTLKPLGHIAFGKDARNRWDGAYAVIHRADLQQVLANAVEALPDCRLHLGQPIEAKAEEDTSADLAAVSGRRPDLIVCADGVWSRHRKGIADAKPAAFSGHVAWRASCDPAEIPFIADKDDVHALMGPGTHLVTYPLGQSGMTNLVAITPGTLGEEGWDAKGDPDELAAHFHRWHGSVAPALQRIDWRYWPLFEVRDTVWKAGDRTALIGDAAHAMTPYAAQGAAMAIEDACELACRFRLSGGKAAAAIAAYEAVREPRVRRVRQRGDSNRFAYHATGPVRIARDLVIRSRGAGGLADGLDWIYGYRAGSG